MKYEKDNLSTPIKHIYRKNQRIFGTRLAKPLILVIPKLLDVAEAKKTWCGKYLQNFQEILELCDNYAN
jgi:lysophospholipase L1-like esterase